MLCETDVVVIGAGPVGLAAAIELGSRGVRVLLAERNVRGGAAPRAKTTNVRTRTHLRRWGIADKLAAASPLGVDYPANVRFVTSLAGFPLARFTNMGNMSPERSPHYPEHGQWIPQYTLERVLLEHARSLPHVQIEFDTSFISAEQDGASVSVLLRSGSGEERTVSARYLIGADGARSAVRDAIGAKLEGRYGLSSHYNIVFRAPGMAERHAHGPANMYWQVSPRGLTVVGPMDAGDVWYIGTGALKEGETLSEEQALNLIRRSTGIDLPYEILSTDLWVASEFLADKYQQGRILLAGDAGHLHPPFGGFGMNLGVGDAVDLGWKIAAILQGWGGPALVESYEVERRPIARAVIDEALANYAIAGKPPAWPAELEHDTPEGEAVRAKVSAGIQASKGREFHTLGTVLGLCYKNSPIIAGEDGASPDHDGQNYRPSARPGCLAPHAWLADGRSLYDLFGPGFSLVVAPQADEGEVERAVADASGNGVPLAVVRPEGVDVRELYEADLTLVRPDQHVAWRGDQWEPVIGRVTGARERVPA